MIEQVHFPPDHKGRAGMKTKVALEKSARGDPAKYLEVLVMKQ